jgi:hypothetical protein
MQGKAPLVVSVAGHHIHTVKALLDAGVNVNVEFAEVLHPFVTSSCRDAFDAPFSLAVDSRCVVTCTVLSTPGPTVAVAEVVDVVAAFLFLRRAKLL